MFDSADPAASALSPREVEHLRKALRTLALVKLGDAEQAEDVAQETLLRVLTALHEDRLNDPSRIYGFIWGVANNVIASTLRKKRRAGLAHYWVRLTARAPDSPLDAIVSVEESERVRRALDQLQPADRDLLRLTYYEGVSSAELASRLGEPAARVRKRKSRALERLRAAFFDRASHQVEGTATIQDHE